MKKYYFLPMISLLLVWCLSCKKGDTGPQGVQGGQGDKGDRGATGPQGPAGNANVKVLLWNNPPDPVLIGQRYYNQMRHAAITRDIIDKGAVLVYVADKISNQWLMLPFSGEFAYYYFYLFNGGVDIVSDNSSINAFNSRVRIVLIGGSSSGVTVVNRNSSHSVPLSELEKARQLYPGVDFTDYNAVKAAFHLED